MSSFLLAFAAVALVSLGSRDQLLVARLSARLGSGVALLVAGSLAAILSAAVMVWAGQAVAGLLPQSARTMLIALALLLAAVELAWPNREKAPAEPTRSFAAVTLVLVARQLGDGARFLVFALAVGTASPLLVGFGAALGGSLAVLLGWALGTQLQAWLPLRTVRVVLAFTLGAAAVVLGLAARGIVG